MPDELRQLLQPFRVTRSSKTRAASRSVAPHAVAVLAADVQNGASAGATPQAQPAAAPKNVAEIGGAKPEGDVSEDNSEARAGPVDAMEVEPPREVDTGGAKASPDGVHGDAKPEPCKVEREADGNGSGIGVPGSSATDTDSPALSELPSEDATLVGQESAPPPGKRQRRASLKASGKDWFDERPPPASPTQSANAKRRDESRISRAAKAESSARAQAAKLLTEHVQRGRLIRARSSTAFALGLRRYRHRLGTVLGLKQ